MPQFLLLLTYDVSQRNSGSTAKVPLKNVKKPTSATETVKSGTISKSEYINLANNIKTNINNQGQAPSYVKTSKGNIKYDSTVYFFSKTMDFYAKNKRLPYTVSVAPWNLNEGISKPTTPTNPIIPTNPDTKFTIAQIISAANNYRKYVDTNYKTPSTVTVNNQKITTAQFLQILSFAITQLNSGSKASITLKTVTNPTNPSETVKAGTFTKANYVKLAQDTKSAICNGQAPNYVNSVLGNVRYETLTYVFAKTIQFYGTNGRLPNTLSVVPYSQLNLCIPANALGIVDQIGKNEATYANIQGTRYSYLDVFLAEGGGNCWGSSLYLYTRLTAAGIQTRIMGYLKGISNNAYKHAWVQINLGDGWKNWDYKKYYSKHYGALGGGTEVALIGPGRNIDTQDLINAYYAVL